MTKQGMLDVLEILTVTYPNYHPEVEKVLKVWGSVLKGYDDEPVKKAVEYYIISDKSGFAPSVGQIIEKMRTITEPEEMSEIEAWNYVSKALGNSIYGYEEEYAKLPKNVQKAVGVAEQLRDWARMDSSEVETVVASNFMRSFRAKEKYRKDMWAVERRKQERISQENLQAIPG